MVTRYTIRKRRDGKWSLSQVEVGKYIRVEHLKNCDTWQDAIDDANWLVAADRALNKIVNRSFN